MHGHEKESSMSHFATTAAGEPAVRTIEKGVINPMFGFIGAIFVFFIALGASAGIASKAHGETGLAPVGGGGHGGGH